MVLTQARLKELLFYDPIVGVFIWRSPTSTRVKIGNIPKPMRGRPYVKIRIDGSNHYAHRLAWMYQHGDFPELGIDHRNTIKFDNAIKNLRPATDTQNGANKPARGASGLKGVRKCPKTGKWVARLKGKHLGTFNNSDAASFVYFISAFEEYGSFARG